MKVALMVGHIGKPNRRDRGAYNTKTGLWEADYNMLALGEIVSYFDKEHLYINIYPLTYGTYKERCAFANRIGASYLISMHLNSFYDPNIDRGIIFHKGLNDEVLLDLQDAVKQLTYYTGREFHLDKADYYPRVMSNLKYSNVPSLLVEPLFMSYKGFSSTPRDEIVQEIATIYKALICYLIGYSSEGLNILKEYFSNFMRIGPIKFRNPFKVKR